MPRATSKSRWLCVHAVCITIPRSFQPGELNRRIGGGHASWTGAKHSRWPAAALFRLRLMGAVEVDAATAPPPDTAALELIADVMS